MLTADQRKELEALEAEMRLMKSWDYKYGGDILGWADRIAAVLANGREE